MDGYFQLHNDETGCALTLYPPTDGGLRLTFDELSDYLDEHGIIFSKVLIEDFLKGSQDGNTPNSIIISEKLLESPINESFKINLSQDLLEATIRFYMPSPGGDDLTMEKIRHGMLEKKLIVGVDLSGVKEFLEDRVYCHTYVVAKAKPAIDGIDAVITYKFNTKEDRFHPIVDEHGIVDFKSIDNINQCHRGDVLAVLTPETAAADGFNVKGERIKAKEAKKAVLKAGKNVEISEDKLSLIALCSGNVELMPDGKVVVSNVYAVKDVDLSTGHIDFDGNIDITGNVNAGFSVKATGNIDVRGVIEGAFVEAEGDINIVRGIKGMNIGYVKAGGNIKAKFIENANIEAGGYVWTEAILASKVIAKTEVVVSGKKGIIAGGDVSATFAVAAKNIGTTMGGVTRVEVGVLPGAKRRYEQLITSISELEKSVEQIKNVLGAAKQKMAAGFAMPPDKLKAMKVLADSGKKKNEQLIEEIRELSELEGTLKNEVTAVISVSDLVTAGTQICVTGLHYDVKSSMKYCKFIKLGDEVKMVSL